MTLRAPVLPPLRAWKRTTASVRHDDEFIALVMDLWDSKKNTTDIAEFTFEDEAVVMAALRIGRERRRDQT